MGGHEQCDVSDLVAQFVAEREASVRNVQAASPHYCHDCPAYEPNQAIPGHGGCRDAENPYSYKATLRAVALGVWVRAYWPACPHGQTIMKKQTS